MGTLALGEDCVAIAASQVISPVRFQGERADAETGLCYNRFRHYDPLAAAYASPDPIGSEGGAKPFAYTIRSPVDTVDPLGLAGGKTTATGESGQQYISGTKPVDGYSHVSDDQIRAAGEDAGWKPKSAGALDNGKPGSFFCCHAEQKAYMNGERNIQVDRDMCHTGSVRLTRRIGFPPRRDGFSPVMPHEG